MKGPVYIHEQIAIEGGARGRLIELVCSRLAPHFERHHGVRLVGAWATVGSTGDWPEVRLHWEMDDWAHFARAQAGRYPMARRGRPVALLDRREGVFRGVPEPDCSVHHHARFGRDTRTVVDV